MESTKNYHIGSLENLEGEFLEIEMCLNSLFDDVFYYEPFGLSANNGQIKIIYIKFENKFSIFFKVLSLKKSEKFDLKKIKAEFHNDHFKFTETDENLNLDLGKYKFLGLDIFNL